jgi:hypothetical protein
MITSTESGPGRGQQHGLADGEIRDTYFDH